MEQSKGMQIMTRVRGVIRTYLGEALVAVGVVHTAAAVGEFRQKLGGIVDDRLWATVDVAASGLRGEALWFTVSGGMLIVTGLLVRSHLRTTGTLPMAFSAGLAILGAALTVAMPDSGAWMALAGGVCAVMVSTDNQRAVRDDGVTPVQSRSSMDWTV